MTSAVKTFFGVLFVLLYAIAVISDGALKGPDAFALRWTVLTLAAGVSGLAAWLRWRSVAGRQTAAIAGSRTEPLQARGVPQAPPVPRIPPRAPAGGAADVLAASKHAILFRQHFPPRHGESALSFFGGAPVAPAGFEWPRPAGSGQPSRPFSFLMQIDCAAVPAAGRRGLLPDRGVLYFFLDLNWGQSDAFRVLYADAKDLGQWRPVRPPEDLDRAFGEHAVHMWRWPQSTDDCPKLLPRWTFDPVVVNVPAPHRSEEEEAEQEDGPVLWPGEKAMAEIQRAAQGEDVGNWFTVEDFAGSDGTLRRPFEHYPHDWRAIQIASGLLATRVRNEHRLAGMAVLRNLSDAERDALTTQISDAAVGWYRRAASYPPFAAVPQPERDQFWSWLTAYPWLVRFTIVDAVTFSVEASLAESAEAAARMPADVARRVQSRHALAVRSERGIFASTPDRMLAPPVDVQGHQWDRAKDHLLLLELSSNEGLGHHFGEGVYQFWIAPADLRARRFDKVQLTADAY